MCHANRSGIKNNPKEEEKEEDYRNQLNFVIHQKIESIATCA
jgi:hypothetical protein